MVYYTHVLLELIEYGLLWYCEWCLDSLGFKEQVAILWQWKATELGNHF